MSIHQINVKSAVLNAKSDCEVNVAQPKCFIAVNEKLVWK